MKSLSSSFKGQDLFDASFFFNVATRPFFYQFIGRLRILCDEAQITATHNFIKWLIDENRLVRWYNQNIDCLEDKMGIEPKKIVNLHGSLKFLKCTVCGQKSEFSGQLIQDFYEGVIPICPLCMEKDQIRKNLGKRPLKIGFLRPDIVLYNEHHPDGESISDTVNEDLKRNPTLILVIGTSLKIPGFKKIIKDFIKNARISSKSSLAIYINKTKASSEWKSIFDYELIGDCDQWCRLIRNNERNHTGRELVTHRENQLIQKDIRDYFVLSKKKEQQSTLKSKKI